MIEVGFGSVFGMITVLKNFRQVPRALESVEIVIHARHSHLGVNYKAVARHLGS